MTFRLLAQDPKIQNGRAHVVGTGYSVSDICNFVVEYQSAQAVPQHHTDLTLNAVYQSLGYAAALCSGEPVKLRRYAQPSSKN
jgi:uncharacterized protein (DUF433 family)